ncbi:MAG: lipid A deacylase LpxR family protein [Alphaproteobacteria bacterium]|nr:lipid A deacylase LpxR family protein [Alphaproteobacteria bacterium]
MCGRLKTFHSVLAMVLLLAGGGSPLADDGTIRPGPTLAQNPAVPRGVPDRRGVYTFINENDLYAIENSDRHYTNGVRLAWLSADDEVPEWGKQLGDALPFLNPEARRRIGWAIGHNLYTPQDKATRERVADDRPYAAFLYVGLALQSETETRLDTLELDIGVVGPAALGKPIQNNYHRLIGAKKAYGWSHQLKNEPGVALAWERKWRFLDEQPPDTLGWDVIPHLAGSIGNVSTYAGAGATFRFGDDLISDFGPPRIRPALPGSSSYRPRDSFGWYLFAGAEGRAVLRDVFLDGNTFTDSHSVSKKPLVADFQAGFALLFERFRLSYTQVMRTREFDGQDRPDFFGSVSISARF